MLLRRFPKTVEHYRPQVEFVADCFGDKNVSELEQLATALYVSRDRKDEKAEIRAEEIASLKPHISYRNALRAVETIDKLGFEAKEKGYRLQSSKISSSCKVS
jgi:hypothetical protein